MLSVDGTQLIEQDLGVDEVDVIDALGEPVVDCGEHRACFVAITLQYEQSRKANGSAQLPRFRVLHACNLAHLFKAAPSIRGPARFHSARALASHVGVIPRVHQSGRRKFSCAARVPLGNARLRRVLWMPERWSKAQGSVGRHHPQTDDLSLQCRQASAVVCAADHFHARCGRRGSCACH